MDRTHADAALAERALNGDEAAWREIYTSTRDRLFAFLSYQLGNRDEAMDVLQDTYVAAVRGLDRYRGEASLESWLVGIALRRAKDWKRKFLRKLKSTQPLDETPLDDQVLPQADPELRLRLRKALDQLPDRQRNTVLLHDYLGFDFNEVGKMLGIGPATARVHAHRGRDALKKILEPPDAEESPAALQEQES